MKEYKIFKSIQDIKKERIQGIKIFPLVSSLHKDL